MRLLTSLKRLEAGAAAARATKPTPIGLVWTANETRIDPECLEPGEYIACDIRLEGRERPGLDLPALDENGDVVEPPSWWSVEERPTFDAADLGIVRNCDGERVGRVVELDGTLVTIEWD